MAHNTLHTTLAGMIEQYSGNEYIMGRLCNYVETVLPAALKNWEKTHQQREERKQQLTSDRNEFTERFMHKSNCFYTPQNELFVRYDGHHFSAYSEDDIQHQILTTITAEKSLVAWKHKIKNNIIKRIRDKSPLAAIPESQTIQFAITSIYPQIFPSKNHAKYFLTVVGDALLGKNEDNLIYIASPSAKELVREIGNQGYTYFGMSNVLQMIKFKFYDHSYTSCRLLHVNDDGKPISISWDVSKYILDILCVATHYSQRYGSADGFLKQCTETRLIDHALYLHRNTPETIVDLFLEKTIQPCQSASIRCKNMIFLWKKFLEEKNVPNIMFYGSLKTMFKNKLAYSEDDDCFTNVTSIHLPLVASFMQFWETTISEDEGELEIEIDELSSVFKNWAGKSFTNATDELLLELIRHFYPDVAIEEDKYILNIKCSLWDKRQDVLNSLELFKMTCLETEETALQSLYGAYQFYSTQNKADCVVSKCYFEKVAMEVMGPFVDEDEVISPDWWKN
jgi:hypothetical protein